MPSQRQHCATCLRPTRACICHCVHPINNEIEIGILQHPNEQHQSKGTARLAQLCLNNAQLWVGDRLEQLPKLQNWLSARPCYLLYPCQTQQNPISLAQVQSQHKQNNSAFRVLLLDGTWRKTKRMLYENPILTDLPRIQLQHIPPSRYQIRKTQQADALSTLEAIACLLNEAQHPEQAQTLLHSFEYFIQQQLNFRKVNH